MDSRALKLIAYVSKQASSYVKKVIQSNNSKADDMKKCFHTQSIEVEYESG